MLKKAHCFFYYVTIEVHVVLDSERKQEMKDYFEEIKGYEEVKRELTIIIDMLNNPDIYKKLGADMDNGVIIVGAPGTGKTTMVNALIKALNRKAYVLRKKVSDGKFIDEVVETFNSAAQNAPSIVFMDDLDKFSDNDDSEDAEEFVAVQSCIDEVKGKDVFVIATANRTRKIPNSLLRPGRLGRRINTREPKDYEAAEIVRYYLDKIGLEGRLDEASIARLLEGESCATLECVIKNAAMNAAFNRQKEIDMNNIVEAFLTQEFGAELFDSHMSQDALTRAAYHEAGHALVAEILDPGSVSIASIRQADDDKVGFVRYYRREAKEWTCEYMENMIKTSLAGRAVTELVFGEVDDGANSDLHNAFDKAKGLADNLCAYGFQNWIEDCDNVYAAENRNRTMTMIIERNYIEVKRMIVNHRDLLEKIVEELLEKTTLIHSDVQRLFAEME